MRLLGEMLGLKITLLGQYFNRKTVSRTLLNTLHLNVLKFMNVTRKHFHLCVKHFHIKL